MGIHLLASVKVLKLIIWWTVSAGCHADENKPLHALSPGQYQLVGFAAPLVASVSVIWP